MIGAGREGATVRGRRTDKSGHAWQPNAARWAS